MYVHITTKPSGRSPCSTKILFFPSSHRCFPFFVLRARKGTPWNSYAAYFQSSSQSSSLQEQYNTVSYLHRASNFLLLRAIEKLWFTFYRSPLEEREKTQPPFISGQPSPGCMKNPVPNDVGPSIHASILLMSTIGPFQLADYSAQPRSARDRLLYIGRYVTQVIICQRGRVRTQIPHRYSQRRLLSQNIAMTKA